MCPSRRLSAIRILATASILNVLFERVSIPSHGNLQSLGTQANYWNRNGIQPARRSNMTAALGAATPTRGLMPALICLDQPPAGIFGADVSQAMHGAIPGSKVSNEVCANCQITRTMLETQRTKTRISRRVRPFSCERTSIL